MPESFMDEDGRIALAQLERLGLDLDIIGILEYRLKVLYVDELADLTPNNLAASNLKEGRTAAIVIVLSQLITKLLNSGK